MKKIAVNTVKNFLKNNKSDGELKFQCKIDENNTFDVIMDINLTVDEKTTFINRVMSGCFDSNDDYRPEYFEPMFRATILQLCTNLPVLTLKGERSEDGMALMDIDAMNNLYKAIGLDNEDDPDAEENNDYVDFAWHLRNECLEAVRWKRDKIKDQRRAVEDRALASLADMAYVIQTSIQSIANNVDSVDMEALAGYAKDLSDASKGLDDGGILNGLLKIHREDKLMNT